MTRLILQSSSTSQIAERLVVSEHTVSDLVAKVFFSHYEPRFRDNERRNVENKPLRGGPKSS